MLRWALCLLLLSAAVPAAEEDPCWLATRKLARSVKRPAGTARFDAEAFERFVLAHPPELQPILRFLGQNRRHVTQAEFETALHRSVDSLAAAIAKVPEGTRIVLVEPAETASRSNRWTLNLLVEYASKAHPELLQRVQVRRSKLTDADVAGPLHVILVDDASYSGAQLADEAIGEMRPDFKWLKFQPVEKRGQVQVHVVVPFVTRFAKDKIQEFSTDPIVFHAAEEMPTVDTLIAQSTLTPEQKALYQTHFQDAEDVVLTSFDHTVADNYVHVEHGKVYASGVAGAASLLDGIVVNTEGKVTDNIPFFHRPPKPYGSQKKKD